jgi:putative ABC transport system ATP-binding protein
MSAPTTEPRCDPARGIVLSARGVTKVYKMGEVDVHALRGVDWDLHEGEMTVLVGASGSGKSTLLNIMGGLDTPTAGVVRYRDQDLSRASQSQLTRFRREHVGFVFQFYNLVAEPHGARERGARHRLGRRGPDEPRRGRRSRWSACTERMPATSRRSSPAASSSASPSRVPWPSGPIVLLVRRAHRRARLQDGPARARGDRAQMNRELGTATVVITHNAPVARIADRRIVVADGLVVADESGYEKLNPRDLSW